MSNYLITSQNIFKNIFVFLQRGGNKVGTSNKMQFRLATPVAGFEPVFTFYTGNDR